MGIIQAVVTVCGVFGIIGLLLVLFCHYLPGWTWTRSYIFNSTKEEKMVLTKPGHYNPNGCMIPSSDSEFNLSGRGSFRRFDKTDHDYSLLRQGSSSSLTRQGTTIPPQPLRPAPIPPYISGPLVSQGSLDSVFTTAPSSPAAFLQSSLQQPSKISLTQATPTYSMNSRGDSGGGSAAAGGFSNNNPFLPLIQASTQYLTQKFQSFQPQQNGANQSSTYAAELPNQEENSQLSNPTEGSSLVHDYSTSMDGSTSSYRNSFTSTSTMPSSAGLSMGEILFSTPPAYSMPETTHPPGEKHDQKMQPIVPEMSTQPQIPIFQEQRSELPSRPFTNETNIINTTHHVRFDPNVFKIGDYGTSTSEKELQNQTETPKADHFEAKMTQGTPKISTKPIPTGENVYKPPEHQNSPTRLRDRQRKMEFTLQHLQNNQEDRPHTKKHYNPDSCYPLSTPYVPKVDVGIESGGSGGGGGANKARFRSPYITGHRSVPPLTEADEQSEFALPITKSSEMTDLKSVILEVEKKQNEELASKSILETMREEIRLENERMADATKSLMMEEDFSGDLRKSNGIGLSSTTNISPFKSTPSIEKQNSQESTSINKRKPQKLSSTEDEPKDPRRNPYSFNSNKQANGDLNANSDLILSQNRSSTVTTVNDRLSSSSVKNYNILDANSSSVANSSSANRPTITDVTGLVSSYGLVNTSPPVVVPFKNTRSFSLRQSSTDSIGSEGSDAGSPDGSLPSLQRAMSCDSVCSDTSVILNDLEPPHPTGHLCIGLEYDSETADLLVNVIEAKELLGPDPSNTALFDSYVRVYLLPDKTTNMQTRVYRKSLNPVYREKFMFGLETMELPLRTLVFYLYATDKHSNTLVGEAELKLGDLDIHQPGTTWLQLTDTGQRGGESGEIMFSLSYLPTAERLTVVVVKARNLKFPHERETGDPFVKVYLLQKGKKVSKKKSSTKRGEKNPIFNEAMIFSVPAHALQTIQLRITVADSSEAEGRAYSVGHVIVGSSVAAAKPLSHWNQMLSSLRKPIAMWHPLRK